MTPLLIKSVKTAKSGRAATITFADGTPLVLHGAVIQQYAPFPGQELTEDLLAHILRADESARAKDAAARLLERRPRTRKELSVALRRKKIGAGVIEEVLNALVDSGLINDAAFAKQFARERAARKDGPRRTRSELAARGVTREAAAEALSGSTSPESQYEAARALYEKWNRRTTPREPEKRARAVASFLARRGHEMDVIRRVLREARAGIASDDE